MASSSVEIVIRANAAQAQAIIMGLRTQILGVASSGQQAGAATARGFSTAAGGIQAAGSAAKGFLAQLGLIITAGAAVTATFGLFLSGIRRVEDFRQTTLGIAAAMTSLDKNTTQANMPQRLAEATRFAEGLYDQILLIDAAFSGSADELLGLAREMTNFGLVLDLNNQKAQEGFRAFAEAVKAAARGLPFQIQASQAVRAILTGQRDEMDQVVRLLGLAGKEGDVLRVRLDAAGSAAERSTIFLEAMRERARGFAAAGGLMSNTLSAVMGTLSAVWTIISRQAFTGVWQDIVRILQNIVSALRTQEGHLTELGQAIANNIKRGWEIVKEAAVDVFEWLRDNGPAIIGAIKDNVDTIADAFGFVQRLVREIATDLRRWNEQLKPISDFLNNIATLWGRIRQPSPVPMTRAERERRGLALEGFEIPPSAPRAPSLPWDPRAVAGKDAQAKKTKEVSDAIREEIREVERWAVQQTAMRSGIADEIVKNTQLIAIYEQAIKLLDKRAGALARNAKEEKLVSEAAEDLRNKIYELEGAIGKEQIQRIGQAWDQIVKDAEEAGKEFLREQEERERERLRIVEETNALIDEANRQAIEAIEQREQEALDRGREIVEETIDIRTKAVERQLYEIELLRRFSQMTEQQEAAAIEAVIAGLEDERRTLEEATKGWKAMTAAQREGLEPMRARLLAIIALIPELRDRVRELGLTVKYDLAKQMMDLKDRVLGGVISAFTDFIVTFVEGAKDAGEAFMQLGRTIINMLLQIAAKAAIIGIISLITGQPFWTLFGKFKEGGISPGHLVPIASAQHGQVFNRPTLAAIAEGGPEAAIPLKNGAVPVQFIGRDRAGEVREIIINLYNVLDVRRVQQTNGQVTAVVVDDLSRRGPIFGAARVVLPVR